MTILGAILSGPEQAIVWTDAEIWQKEAVSRYEPKLAVNTLLCAVGCGTGAAEVLDAGDAAVSKATDADLLPKQISDALRSATVKYARHLDKRAEIFDATYCLAAWSPSAGRMLAWNFGFQRFFAAVLETRLLSPAIGLPPVWCPREPADVVLVARRQMAAMRRLNPDSGAGDQGALVVAEIRCGGLRICSMPNFDADHDTRPEPAGAVYEIRDTARRQHAEMETECSLMVS